MKIDEVLKLNDMEQSILADTEQFNCSITVKAEGKLTTTYLFDDYRVAQAVKNLLDNVRFVKKQKDILYHDTDSVREDK